MPIGALVGAAAAMSGFDMLLVLAISLIAVQGHGRGQTFITPFRMLLSLTLPSLLCSSLPAELHEASHRHFHQQPADGGIHRGAALNVW